MWVNQLLAFRLESDKRWLGLVVWAAAWTLMAAMDGFFSLGNLALLLISGGSLAGLWLSPRLSLLLSAISVSLFSFFFVDPRLAFMPALHEDLLLLVTLLGVSTGVSYLMARLRGHVINEQLHAMRAEQLRALSEALRTDADIRPSFILLLEMLKPFSNGGLAAAFWLQAPGLAATDRAIEFAGDADIATRDELSRRVRSGSPSSRLPLSEEQPWLIPVRGASQLFGCIGFAGGPGERLRTLGLDHVRELAALLGHALERAAAVRDAQAAREEVQSQQLRNTLLTAISHDYRTPLANVMGAASAISAQAGKMPTEQITGLSQTILVEAEHLARMTANTLQLARLGSGEVSVIKNWESPEEIIGNVLARVRGRHPERMLQAELPAQLPLLYCDAILIVQLFENLLENSLKYSPSDRPVRIETERLSGGLIVSVDDEGPGVPDAWKRKVFEPFQRIVGEGMSADANAEETLRRGAGIGLAVCRAIARVHDAEIWVEDGRGGGSRFRTRFPVLPQPKMTDAAHMAEAG